jgi:hypothetical protein
MQNKATWLATVPEGFKVRVQFIPINPAEQKRAQAMLLDLLAKKLTGPITVLGATTQGPLSVDLLFTSAVAQPVPVPEQPKVAAPVMKPSVPAAAPEPPKPAEPAGGATPSTQKTDKVQ